LACALHLRMAASRADPVSFTAAEAGEFHVATESPMASANESKLTNFMCFLPLTEPFGNIHINAICEISTLTERFGHALASTQR
jgi:hypothetical protein